MLSDNENIFQGIMNGRKKKPSKKLMTKSVSMTFSNVRDTKNIEDFLVWNIMENHYESEDENPPHHSEAGQMKYLQKTLNLCCYWCHIWDHV